MKKNIYLLALPGILLALAACGHTHTPIADAPVPATCTQSGTEGGVHCGECGEILVQGYVVAATGHTCVEDPAVPATADTPGRTAGSHCSVCNQVLTPQTIIEPLPKTSTGNNTSAKHILVRVPNGDQPIFDGPGYGNNFVQTVGVAGTYTIVAQKQDSAGNLWGKLKSGLGWIDLANLQPRTLVTADFADSRLLASGDYHCYGDPGDADLTSIVFRTTETVYDVSFSSFDYVEETPGSPFFRLPELTASRPLVMNVMFWGDFTAYCLSFTDQNGTQHAYSVMLSLSDTGGIDFQAL